MLVIAQKMLKKEPFLSKKRPSSATTVTLLPPLLPPLNPMIINYLNPKVAVVAVKLINNIVMGRSDNSLNHVIIIVVIKVYGQG